MRPKQFIEMLVKIYEPGGTFGLPPDASISIGHWVEPEESFPPQAYPPRFVADVKITLTELKGMLNGTD